VLRETELTRHSISITIRSAEHTCEAAFARIRLSIAGNLWTTPYSQKTLSGGASLFVWEASNSFNNVPGDDARVVIEFIELNEGPKKLAQFDLVSNEKVIKYWHKFDY
jgi:hypothetical protein